MGQGQPGPDGPQGLQGMRGPKGMQGEQGPPGDKGDTLKSINYDEYSNILLSDSNIANTISNLIISSDKLQKNLLNTLSNNEPRKISIQNSIMNNSEFVNYIANRLSNEPTYVNKLKGPQGDTGIADYDKLSQQIMTDSERKKLIKSFTFNDTELEAKILSNIGNLSLRNSITNSTDMAKKVAYIAANNQTAANILKGTDGVPGAFSGDYNSIRSVFHHPLPGQKYGAIMWCADSTMCYPPENVNGIGFKNTSIKRDKDNNIIITADTLNANGNLSMKSATIDGRLNTLALHFPNGEMLWPTEDSKNLNISYAKITENNMLDVNSINIKNKDGKFYSIQQEGNSLYFRYNGKQMFYITPGGSIMFNGELKAKMPVFIGDWKFYTRDIDWGPSLVITPKNKIARVYFRDPNNTQVSNRLGLLRDPSTNVEGGWGRFANDGEHFQKYGNWNN